MSEKMKILIMVFVVAFAFCTTAMASDIAFYVGAPNVDGWYDVDSMNADVETIIAETGVLFMDVSQFDDDQYDEFGAWVEERTDDGKMDIIWLNGCMPSVLYPFPNLEPDGSLIEEWLDGGNMIINVGDWFGYVSYAGGARQTENGTAGAANILDLSSGIIVSADNTSLTVTPTGAEYLPSLGDTTVITYRPIAISAVAAPWEVAATFATTGGTDDPGEAQADPLVIHNTETDGYVAFINQSAGSGPPGWLDDRGLTCAEFIVNWVNEVIGLGGGGNPFARRPVPEDGALHEDTWISMSWKAGYYAVSHDAYISDNFDDVNNGAEGTFAGNLGTTNLVAGFPGFPLPDGLIPGTTYYWRIDEVNEADPNSPWKGPVWSFTIPPKTAYNADPADGAKFIDPNADLSWTPGFGGKLHTVYFGESFDDVNNAAGGLPQGVTSYALDTLEPDKTYYWRVDEFDAMATYKGNVWSFTTAVEGGGVRGEYYTGMSFGNLALTRIDPQINFNWGDPGGPDPAVGEDTFSARWTGEVEAAFTETYTFYTNSDDGIRLWIDGQQLVNNWTDHGTIENRGTIDLAAGSTYSLVMEYYENGGGAVAELRWSSPSTPKELIPQAALSLPVKAGQANPSNNAVDVSQRATLSWSAGEATASHDVYFGTDADAVRNADTSSPEYKGSRQLDSESYDPGQLEWGTTYYWRVDEIEDGGTIQTGNVWSFTTANFLIVDDMESYNDIDEGMEGSNRIYNVWVDGFSDPTNGSQAGHLDPPFYEDTIVHSGNQSMPLYYDNAVGKSEVTLTLDYPRDWTENGVDTLAIWYIGDAVNAVETMYVVLNGSAGVDNPDANAAQAGDWTELRISLQDFGTNLTNVNTITIGFGNRTNPVAGGAGTVYFDDIRLLLPTP